MDRLLIDRDLNIEYLENRFSMIDCVNKEKTFRNFSVFNLYFYNQIKSYLQVSSDDRNLGSF